MDKAPTTAIRRVVPERSRDRTLSKTELVAVWNASASLTRPFDVFFRLAILTGQRRSEIAEARWSEFDLDAATWTIPSSRAKNGKAHLVHLSPEALDSLSRVPRIDDSDLVFTTNGRTAISGFSKVKRELDSLSGVTGWTIHDLRRTFASLATGELDLAPVVIDKILNHSSGAVTGIAAVYQRHAYLPQRKDAMHRWGAFVASITR